MDGKLQIWKCHLWQVGPYLKVGRLAANAANNPSPINKYSPYELSIMKLQTVLNVFALGLLSIVSTQAEVSSVSASPNPLRQGNNLTIRATVDRPGLIHFFFKGRPFGNPVYATGPGIYSTRAFVEANNVPAGKQCKECAVGAKQGKHTENAWIQVCR